jgi:hypothetical protein
LIVGSGDRGAALTYKLTALVCVCGVPAVVEGRYVRDEARASGTSGNVLRKKRSLEER